jgi:glutamate-1-semialdehyde 2,1-aminomutase
MLFGHAHPAVVEAIAQAAARGTSYGAPTELEAQFAEKLCELYPSMQMVRAVSSGTEATMSAVRAARGATGRKKIIKMEGCYHGHADLFLVKGGSGMATLGAPDSDGVTDGATRDTLVAPYNQAAFVAELFLQHPEEIAAIIVEPVAGNMGCVPPVAGYLARLAELAHAHGALLIFDEVMTGCRLAKGGAQEHFGVAADMTTLGKIIGGGLPLAAYGGSKAVMSHVAPLGKVYQAGTLSGNPVAVSAGLATLSMLSNEVYQTLENTAKTIADGMTAIARAHGVPVVVQRVGSMFTVFFTDRPSVRNWDDAKTCETGRFAKFHRGLLDAGVYFPPSQFEAAFVSTAHGPSEIEHTLQAVQSAIKAL